MRTNTYVLPLLRPLWKASACAIALIVLVAGVLTGAAATAATAADSLAGLEIGILPYIHSEGLLKIYGPLAEHLEEQLKLPVRITSARDYPAMLRLTAAKAYPLLITASHFGRLAQLETGYRPILVPFTRYHELVLVKDSSPLRSYRDLSGAKIAVVDMLAQVRMMFAEMLRAHGLDPFGDVRYLTISSHTNAIYAVRNGDAEAGLISEGAYRAIAEQAKAGLRLIEPEPALAAGRNDAIPVMILASPDLPAGLPERLAALITSFAKDHPVGQRWIAGLQYQGFRPPTAAELTALDGQVQELYRALDLKVRE